MLRGNYPIGGNIGGEFGLCDVTLLPACVPAQNIFKLIFVCMENDPVFTRI